MRITRCGTFFTLLVTFTLLVCASCSGPTNTSAPSRVLDLTNWKLTLPTSAADSNEPEEVKQPSLNTYESQFFQLNNADNGVVFRANAGGTTTIGSDFARSELRQMTDTGTQPASWSNGNSTHTMTVREAITHLPPVHPAIVASQIHDASDYVVLIRLDGTRLFVKADNKSIGDLNSHYQLGSIFTLKFMAASGHIKIYYNGKLMVDYLHSCQTCYFKVGAYLQSNPSLGDATDAYGEVVVYSLQVS